MFWFSGIAREMSELAARVKSIEEFREDHQDLCTGRWEALRMDQRDDRQATDQSREKMNGKLDELKDSVRGLIWRVTVSIIGLLASALLGVVYFVLEHLSAILKLLMSS